MSQGYRPDIDGLRALSVLGVVVFHFFPTLLPGGFTGVDVFFVISGYLITRNVAERPEPFSAVDFYARRARRILPALVVLCLATVLVGWVVLLPVELRRLADSLVATGAFASNLLFWFKTNYFEPAADTHPLLHTWSLAVEEQYYLAFPVLVLLVPRARWRAVFALVALCSFIAAAVTSVWVAPFAFFMPFTRAWELLVGALLALRAGGRHRTAGVGVLLLGLGLFAARPDAFPLPWALVPVAGAALALHAAPSLAGRWLSAPPLVAIGRGSYSLYLWHWPVIVYLRLVFGPAMPTGFAVAGLVASAVLSWLSYRWVEVPLRSRRGTDRRTLSWAVVALVLLVVLGGVLRWQGGVPGRVSPEVLALEAAALDVDPTRGTCMDRSAAQATAGALCEIGAPVPPSVLLWGDSHAHAFAAGLDVLLQRTEQRAWLSSTGSCAPFTEPSLLPAGEQGRRCLELNLALLDLVARTRPRLVILVASWNHLAGAFEEDGVTRRVDQSSLFARALRDTVTRLRAAGAQVVVMEEVPGARAVVPLALARAAMLSQPASWLEFDAGTHEARAASVRRALTVLRQEGLLRAAINPADAVCDGQRCRVLEGQPLYVDSDHLSLTGARWLANAQQHVWRAALERTPP